MKIAARTSKEKPADPRQHRISEIAVQRRHRRWFDAARKAISHDQLVTGTEFVEKRPEVREVVTVVGVTHDDVLAARRLDPAAQGAAVAFFRDVNDTRAAPS